MNKQKTAVVVDSGCDVSPEFRQKYDMVVDSGCDVSPEFRQKYDIRLLPFKVRYPEKEYLDAVDIDPMMVYRRFPGEIPTTSTPSPGDVVELMKGLKEEGFENVFVFCISDKLSGTYNTCRNPISSV